MTHSLN